MIRKERFIVAGVEVVEMIYSLIKVGKVHRIVVKHQGRTLLDLPVSVCFFGVVLAPVLAAVSTMFIVLTRCIIEVYRDEL